MGVLAEFEARQRRIAYGAGLAAAVGLIYFLTARLSLGLLLEPDGVAVFWPAAGISSGVLIALGPRARWPVAAGAVAGTIAANLMGDRSIAATFAFALCNAAEALIAAGLIQHFFDGHFTLNRLQQVVGLLAAAVVATTVSGIGGTVGYKLFHYSTASMLTTWWHWFASDAIGILAVAPLVIGLAAAARKPPPRSEILEAIAALAALAAMTGIIVSLPAEPWQTVVPGALLFPILLWLAARFRPVFAAVGGFMVSVTIVWTTIFGIGHFGHVELPIDDRILQAQAVILVATLGPLVLAALFAERRRAEAQLARSKLELERERDNRLMNVEAVTAAIAHEIKQPLHAIAIEGGAALKLLAKTPPDLAEAREAVSCMIGSAHRTNEVFDGIRALFRKGERAQRPIDVNATVLEVLRLVREELKDRGVFSRVQLASALPPVPGNSNQLREVVLNLVQNALEAMAATSDRIRELSVRTELRGSDAIAIAVEDSGPGIDRDKLKMIFDAFFTTKRHGMGLGLAICRMIIERHGGQLTAWSDGESGALLTIVLPVNAASEAAAE